MRRQCWIFLVAALTLSGCKTTSGGGNDIKWYEGSEAREKAQKTFVASIEQCIPMLLMLVPGKIPVDLAKDPAKHAVVEAFVDKMLTPPSTPFDHAARLAKYYANDQAAGKSAPCTGEAVEYLLFVFAGRTNVLSLKSGPDTELKILY